MAFTTEAKNSCKEVFHGFYKQRRALVLILLSLILWEGWEGLRVFTHPWGDLKGATYTDHFSHMNAARVFPRIGIETWRRPLDQMFRSLTPAELAATPKDIQAGGSSSGGIFHVPGWPAGKPLVISWSNNPRNYPPGDMLLVAPIAILYHYADLSFTTANRLLLMLLLIYVHMALFFFFKFLPEFIPDNASLARIQVITAAVVYIEVIHWTLEGFYDAAALAPLVLCGWYIRQRKGLPAIAAFCLAAFLHFRVFFFAPLAVYALVIILRDRQWRRWRVRQWVVLAAAGMLGAVSLGVFWILWPSLRSLPITNPIDLSNELAWLARILLPIFLILAWLAARSLLRLQAWLDFAIFIWMAIMMFFLHETYPWHTILAVMPWLCFPPFVMEPSSAMRIQTIRLLVFAGAIGLVFRCEPFAIWRLWQ
jgi:hypothetical protein